VGAPLSTTTTTTTTTMARHRTAPSSFETSTRLLNASAMEPDTSGKYGAKLEYR
jgi:hypothetical protein